MKYPFYSINRYVGRILSLILLLVVQLTLHAQHKLASFQGELAGKEDSLKWFADSMINAVEAPDRFRADSNFVRSFVRALKYKGSFAYPFDSLLTISKLYPADSSFRIFTWQLKKDQYTYLQKGAIQVHTDDGSLKLFPLFDYSMFTAKANDSVRTPENWIGAIYYRIIEKSFRGKKYYTLLGFDDFSVSSNKKWIEVLHFNDKKEPVFGGPYFSYKDDTTKQGVQPRFVMEYKKEANTVLNYDPEMDMIIYDHLVSETEEPEKKNTYIPDGTYEGFKWRNGQWLHVDKVFNFSLKDGQFPVDEQLRDAKGNIDEDKLEKASQRNIEKAKKKSTIKN